MSLEQEIRELKDEVAALRLQLAGLRPPIPQPLPYPVYPYPNPPWYPWVTYTTSETVINL